jgi:hypothetical protein
MAARALVATVALAFAFAATASGCTCRRANGLPEEEARSPVEQRATTEPRAAVLRGSAQCGSASRDGDVRWIGTEEEYQAALAALDRGRLPGTAPAPVPVDFGTHGVLIVRMGERPTAGYALELASEQVVSDDGTGAVRVNWTEPPEDAMVAQVLTSPCLLIAVRKEGLRAIKVVDQAGRARGTVELR